MVNLCINACKKKVYTQMTNFELLKSYRFVYSG